jgi:hypothetical protein
MHALLLWLALGQAEPAPPPASSEPPPPAVEGRALRSIDFTRLDDATFRATLDGEPVAGAAFYRAVLRPDLAARSEDAQHRRTALLIGAGLAPVAGLGIGWAAGTAQQWPLPPCVGAPPGPVSCTAHDQVAAQNRSTMTRRLVAGGVVGLAAGVALALAGTSIRPLEPTADEAEALVRAYRARATPGRIPAPMPGGPAGNGTSLELEAGRRSARLGFRLRF